MFNIHVHRFSQITRLAPNNCLIRLELHIWQCHPKATNPMGLIMQVSVQFPGISVTILDVLYVVYIIITSVHQKF